VAAKFSEKAVVELKIQNVTKKVLAKEKENMKK